MKNAFIAAAAALVFSACATDPETPDTICFDDWIYASDVYGTGNYTEYREEFEKETGCRTQLQCAGKMKIHRCVENVEFK